MLQFFRKYSFLSLVVIFVLFLSFFFFGAWFGDRNPSSQNFRAGVNTYSYEDLGSKGLLLSKQFGAVDFLQILGTDKSLRFNPSYFAENRIVLRKIASSLGVDVGKEELKETLRRFFTNKEGKFDAKVYKNYILEYLKKLDLTERDIYALIKDQLLLDRMLSLFSSGVAPFPEVIEKIFLWEEQKTYFKLIEFPDKKEKIVLLSEKDLKKFWAKRKTFYHAPETREFSFILVKDTEENRKKIQRFLGKMNSENSEEIFKKAAEKENFQVEKLPFVSKAEMPLGFRQSFIAPSVTIADKLFSLSSQTLSPVMRDAKGNWVYFWLHEIKPFQKRDFSEIAKEVEKDFFALQQRQSAFQRANTLKIEIENFQNTGGNLPDFFTKRGISLQNLQSFEQKNKNWHAFVKEKAKYLALGKVSSVIRVDNSFLLLYVKNRSFPSSLDREKLKKLQLQAKIYSSYFAFKTFLEEERKRFKLSS